MSREEDLEFCLQNLLECRELQTASDGTRAAIEEATAVLEDESEDRLGEVYHTVVYIGEQVELIRTALDRLCVQFDVLKKAIENDAKQKTLF